MKYLVLLTLLACNAQKTETNPALEAAAQVTEEVPTEGAVSCVCNKIYMPVCVDGQTFPNSCEAECQGFEEWKEGSCE